MIRSFFCLTLVLTCLSSREARAEPLAGYLEGTFVARARPSANFFLFGEVRHLEGGGPRQIEESLSSALVGCGANLRGGVRIETGVGFVGRYDQGWRTHNIDGIDRRIFKIEQMSGWAEGFRVFVKRRRVRASGEVLIGMPFHSSESAKPFIEGRYALSFLLTEKWGRRGHVLFGIHVDELNTRLSDGIDLTFEIGETERFSARVSLDSGLTEDAPEWSSRISLVVDLE